MSEGITTCIDQDDPRIYISNQEAMSRGDLAEGFQLLEGIFMERERERENSGTTDLPWRSLVHVDKTLRI